MFSYRSLRHLLIWAGSIGFVAAIFPWVFSFQGQYMGYPVSIRSIGNVLGGGFIVLSLTIYFSEMTRDFFMQVAVGLESMSRKSSNRLIWAGTALFLLGAISHKLRAHAMLSTHAFDLGFFSNICWNTAQGNWFFSSELERNFMGVHANWILWPLSLFYPVWPDSRILLVAQAVFMSAAVPLLFFTVRKVSESVSISVMASLMFVCSPYFLHSTFNDFHPDSWQLPWLMASLWAYHKKMPRVLIFSCLVALCAKEDVSIIVSGFALTLILSPHWRRVGIVLVVMAVSVFLVQTQLLVPKFIDNQHQSLLFHRYDFLGNSYGEILKNIFTRPTAVFSALVYEPSKYWRTVSMLFPAAGFTVFAPVYLLPPLISMLPHLLSQAHTQLSLADIYAIPVQPFVFIGGVVGYMKLLKRGKLAGRESQLAVVCFIVAGMGILHAPRTFRTLPKERRQAFAEMKRMIPVQSTLAAQQSLQPHFDTRRYIQLFPIGVSMAPLQKKYLSNPEYVVCDRVGNALPADGETLRSKIKEMERDERYEKIFDQENFVLFARIEEESMRWMAP